MATNYQYRFMRLMSRHSPIKRGELTRRALGQLRGLDMPSLTAIVKECLSAGLINQYQVESSKSGINPDVFTITEAGEQWLEYEE